MNLTSQELAKMRKVALHSVTLSSDMKTSAVDSKLRELTAEIKKVLAKNGVSIEIFVTTTGAVWTSVPEWASRCSANIGTFWCTNGHSSRHWGHGHQLSELGAFTNDRVRSWVCGCVDGWMVQGKDASCTSYTTSMLWWHSLTHAKEADGNKHVDAQSFHLKDFLNLHDHFCYV